MKLKKILKRAVPVVLAATLVFIPITNSYVYGEDILSKRRTIVCEDGVTYTLDQTKTGDKYSFMIKKEDCKDYAKVVVDKKKNVVSKEEYQYVSNGQYNLAKTQKFDSVELGESLKKQISNNALEINNKNLQGAISYGKKVKDGWKNKYWYSNGKKGKNTYLKIGCKATYRIRTDNLSSKKMKKCNAYTAAVKTSAKSMDKAYYELADSIVNAGVILALVTANFFLPSSLIDLMLFFIYQDDSIVEAGEYMVESISNYFKAKDLYTVIRTYGTKL